MDIAALLALREGTTPGPWGWFGNASYRPSVYLATRHSGRRYVMDFVRWGMQGAQPRFQPARFGMVDAKDLIQFEVGDQSVRGIDAAKADTSVYRLDVRGIDAPDARLIAAAPELLDALDAQAREIAALKKDQRWIIKERDVTFALMLARAEAAEAKVARLLESVREARDAAHSVAHSEFDGVLSQEDFDGLTPLADAALAEIGGGNG